MKTHLTESDILEMAYTKLGMANPNVDKTVEFAELMDLDYDEKEGEYHNPDCCNCGKVYYRFDNMFRLKYPRICVACFTSNG